MKKIILILSVSILFNCSNNKEILTQKDNEIVDLKNQISILNKEKDKKEKEFKNIQEDFLSTSNRLNSVYNFFGVGQYKIDSYDIKEKLNADYQDWDKITDRLKFYSEIKNNKIVFHLSGIDSIIENEILELTKQEYSDLKFNSNEPYNNIKSFFGADGPSGSYSIALAFERDVIEIRIYLQGFEYNEDFTEVIKKHKFIANYKMK